MDSVLRSRPTRDRRRFDVGRTNGDSRPTPPTPQRKAFPWRRIAVGGLLVVLLTAALAAAALWRYFDERYEVAATMQVPLEEVTTAAYPEDPAGRSIHYGQYNGRRLVVVQKDDKHFDFVLEPTADHVARIAIRDVDVGLMTPSVPQWCKDDAGLTRIALVDREWNRQQVFFDAGGPHVEITGGNGFEARRLHEVALAKNCLNAGLWEVILTVEEDGDKAMYYQGWFTFPLGHYRRILEQNTGLDYADHWHRLEHWCDPAGTVMHMDRLRSVYGEREVAARFDRNEAIIVAGEQVRKRRTTNGPNLVTWGDILEEQNVEFATFVPPGRYSVRHPWKNEYWRLASFDKAILREITTPAGPKKLHELELVFRDRDGNPQRFIVGGVDLASLPRLPIRDYPEGLYMPMGIGVPPFYQDYAQLQANPPQESPYYSFLLDGADRWIDHHKAAIDGPVMHRDANDPNLVHLYLLSYERHTLVAHITISIAETAQHVAREGDSVAR